MALLVYYSLVFAVFVMLIVPDKLQTGTKSKKEVIDLTKSCLSC